ncbi:MAG: tRNA guanosine(34) transglycosylase Tgt [Candidatus Comchoanobacterales bacterium]
MDFTFEILHQSTKSKARVGRIHTPHGIIETPGFVPVATNATLKCISSEQLSRLDVDLIFCNTYHLMLQPGVKTVEQLGGLHSFMNRSKPIITDSGGFQVFSLAYGSVANELKSQGMKSQSGTVLKITEEGVRFRSYRDGAEVFLTAESSVDAQKSLGADIIIPFDELPPFHMKESALRASLDRTHRWEKRSLDRHLHHRNGQAMYAVIHGGLNDVMRKESATYLSSLDFDGFAIGGSLGRNSEDLYNVLSYSMPFLPPDFPKHLLGIGDVPNIEVGIPFGIDTFDSSYPTKIARHGAVLVGNKERLKLKHSRYSQDTQPLEPGCACSTCLHYSRAYLHHLLKSHEPVVMSLLSIHNITWMVNYFKRIREAILNNKL